MLGCSTLRVKFLYHKKAPIVNKMTIGAFLPMQENP